MPHSSKQASARHSFPRDEPQSVSPPALDDVLRHLYSHDGRPEHPGPDDLLGTLVQTILSQRRTCHARTPDCQACPLAAVCPWTPEEST